MSQNYEQKFKKNGIAVPEILLPSDAELEKWAVIACDQFSSEPDYWKRVEENVGGKPSALNLILPEVYLEEQDESDAVNSINGKMKQYLDEGVFSEAFSGMVYVERSTPHAACRKGLVLAIDLETYDFTPGSKSLIRPTEKTVLERLPPRVRIRKDAWLDLPHILILVDDPEDKILSTASAQADKQTPLYDFDLMENGGHLSGYGISGDKALEELADVLDGIASGKEMLFAVGDGNHSLAAAKTIWDEKKKNGASDNDPARYVLVELENIHDKGLHFHPIHRVLFNIDGDKLIQYMKDNGAFFNPESVPDGYFKVVYLEGGDEGICYLPSCDYDLAAEALQPLLDSFLDENPEVNIDYIHGNDSVRHLSSQKSNFGFLLPEIEKDSFFTLILKKGVFPRKTFSIGEAVEKRYYMEARQLK